MGYAIKYPGVEPRAETLRVVFRYQGRRCRESLDLRPTPANLKHASRLRERVCDAIRAGVFDYAEFFPDSPNAPQTRKRTFGELTEDWMNDNAGLALATRRGYRQILAQLYDPWHDVPIEHITYRMIQDVLQGHPWRSMKTRNNALTPLRGIFDLALQEGIIDKNPVLRVKRIKSQRPPPDPLDMGEVNAVLDWIEQHRHAQHLNYFEFAIFTGLRTSELIALTWADIDMRQGYARVERAKVLGEIKPTKTYSVRDIELNSRALAALKRQKAHTLLAAAEVFLDPITSRAYVDDKPPRLVWDAALRSLGIRHRAAYQTRHTFATLLQ